MQNVDPFDDLRTQAFSREAALAADLQLAKAEIQHQDALNNELQKRNDVQLQEFLKKELEMNTQIAALQIRCEQLSITNQEYRTDLLQFKKDHQLLVRQIDCAREEFLNMKRTNQNLSEENTKLNCQIQNNNIQHRAELERSRQQFHQIAGALGNKVQFQAAIDAVQQADGNTSLLICKIASLAEEVETLKSQNKQQQEENAIIQNQLDRLKKLINVNGQGQISVQLMLEQIGDMEKHIHQLEKQNRSLKEGTREQAKNVNDRDFKIRRQDNQIKELTDSLKELQSVRDVVRTLIAQEVAGK